MEVNVINLRKSINKAYLKVKPNRTQIETFKANIINLFGQIKESESEEFHKNIISEFLKNTYYSPYHYINTKGRSDLVIHNGKDSNSSVGVLFEVKKPNNKSEVPTTDNINTKAFHELILYYLRERVTNKNLEIKHLVITNTYEWFIFNSNDFEKLFAENKSLVKQFIDFEEGRLSGTNTDFFYKNIAEPVINNLDATISISHFDLREFEVTIMNGNREDDNQLIALFKILSREHLLKLPFANDSNNLDKAFYSELLHIIGLEETKEGGKKLIGRKQENRRNSGSLIENAITILKYEDCLSHLPKLSDYGKDLGEQSFNVALELIITWINRILFLKLLEGQLLKYSSGDNTLRFLNYDRIHDFDELNKLFFHVLAVKEVDRSEQVKSKFGNIPYLNSSLFEPSELEHKTIRINSLDDHTNLPVLSSTVLKDRSGKRIAGEINPLDYLFRFLDSYDFSSEGSEEIQEENKTLINASVLGLIFEKINGYKEGSFFTPGFITMYMCQETIRRSVIQKFNEVQHWNCASISDVYNKMDDIKAANNIINSLRICDPAVGSGHFLVSALNELIAIKSELKILTDREGKRLKEYFVEVINDELIITDEQSKLFEYKPRNKESQRIQEAIFHEKQTIIENCLFGVDINPNSVKICRLRLWIELLKNAYYKADKNFKELETLPNIDINIKCGNSLISRYSLDADIKAALKSSKWTIDNYREAIMTYRNANTKEEKRSMEQLISKIKSDFELEISKSDKRFLKLNKLNGELLNLTNQSTLFDLTKKQKEVWNSNLKKVTEAIKKLEQEIKEIKSNKIYENAFEWRFEFPEVLNMDGEYVGFDIVIGNPPYIRQEYIGVKYKAYLVNEYSNVGTGTADIYVYFFGRALDILTKTGFLSFITLNKWLKTQYGKNLRNYLKKFNLFRIIDFFELPVFEEASTDSAITFLSKNDDKSETQYIGIKSLKDIDLEQQAGLDNITVVKEAGEWKFINNRHHELVKRIENVETTLGELINDRIYLGIKTGLNRAFIIPNDIKESLCLEDSNAIQILKPYLGPTSFNSYLPNWEKEWIIMSHNGQKEFDIPAVNVFKDYPNIYRYLNQFSPDIQQRGDRGIHWSNLRDCAYLECFYKPKIIYVYTAKTHHFLYDEKGFVVNNSCFIISTNNKFVWAFLNSSLFKFYQRIKFVAYGDAESAGRVKLDRNKMLAVPIKNISENKLKEFDKLYELLKNQSLEEIQSLIDTYINRTYGLTPEEIILMNQSLNQ